MSSSHNDFDVPSNLPSTLPLVPLRRGVLLPGTTQPFAVARPLSASAIDAAVNAPIATRGLVLVGVQHGPLPDPAPSDIHGVATLARVVEQQRSNETNGRVVVLRGIARVQISSFASTRPYLEANYTLAERDWPVGTDADAMAKTFRETVVDMGTLLGDPDRAKSLIASLPTVQLLVDSVAGLIDAPHAWKTEILQTFDPLQRAEKVLRHLLHLKEVVDAQSSIRNRLESETKEHVLRRQLDAIQRELGENDSDDQVGALKERLAAKKLPDEVRQAVDREIKRLERLNAASPERSVAVDWLEWIADLPFGVETAKDVDLQALEDALDKSHYGLKDVKRQVLEHLSVRKLQGEGRADVLLLVGPPGVGKTSIGQAIADATGRKLVRVALGGARDEATLRGHRRTYIGSRPGRIVEGLRRAGAQDPVILLDEVDKIGASYQGDPASALLEILDPEQNHAFTDHYLDVPFDLSKVLFIATANQLSTIPDALRDRMETLDIAGYTPDEKVVIAKSHLMVKLAKNVGLPSEAVSITDDALKDAIEGWTREAGVRQLQRTLGRVWREAAVRQAKGTLVSPYVVDKDELKKILGRRRFEQETHEVPERAGIATGLAWTPAGGDVLYVEASLLPGSGQLILTGQLGDVMKESARAALTFALSRYAGPGGIEKRDVHIHVPAGAVPKDGPSAGVTMFTALASLITGRPVRRDLAMTGEATLRGRVLPVGGIKSKVLAAHRYGIKTLVLPRKNGPDLEDVPKTVLDELQIVLVDTMDEVLAAALEDGPKTLANSPHPTPTA